MENGDAFVHKLVNDFPGTAVDDMNRLAVIGFTTLSWVEPMRLARKMRERKNILFFVVLDFENLKQTIFCKQKKLFEGMIIDPNILKKIGAYWEIEDWISAFTVNKLFRRVCNELNNCEMAQRTQFHLQGIGRFAIFEKKENLYVRALGHSYCPEWPS